LHLNYEHDIKGKGTIQQYGIISTKEEFEASSEPERKNSIAPSLREMVERLEGGKCRCTSCDKTFNSYIGILQHLDLMHNEDADIYQCSLCKENGKERIVKSKRRFRTHLNDGHHIKGKGTLQQYGIISTKKEFEASRLGKNRVNNKIKRKEKKRHAILRQRDNKLIAFGEGYPKLIQEIRKNSKKFKMTPIGPLGTHIKLTSKTSPVEARLVEYTIGSLLRAFITDNFDDKMVLDQVASRCNLQLTIVTSKFRDEMYDILEGRCRSKSFDTVFDRLQFDNPNVANCLIDQCEIERILLINEDSRARKIFMKKSTTPKNCLSALTNGYNMYHSAPYRKYALDIDPKCPLLLQTIVDDMEQEKV